ncbi:PTS sugar transporter subunit IIA [Mammaliicoccus stepanovicii]|uniref:PTS system glucose-specific EIIA component n=1 Tax=Mammaliicoccus stepanovicii TaxID=643214 RepID=A0A239ZAF7_9STAP|nr:PTS glucose transporter subunit IIA [Mammaliicoccus stepanovicii]PNZ73868.1 PTS glucose transporter subunit IIA [Mammaliicoccus stepanovicii]GGI42182.1 PTS system glucose-specific EIIA component [Mammaliicoccus stepanovicii]SNV68105.1 PTS system glucose-specific transporter subunit IIA [Mammaliicoccus stepanovicii]
MFKKLFGGNKSKDTNVDIYAPISGEFVSIEDIPDPVFAQKMMGEGFGIKPTEGVVVAPFDGEIVNVFKPSNHAVGIKAANGLEVLIHVGLETVQLGGEGFEALVNTGDVVSKGDELLKFDIETIDKKVKSVISPVIITNTDDAEDIQIESLSTLVKAETKAIEVKMK